MSFECIASEVLRARKRHRCTWCGQHIDIGEHYTRQRVIVDGDIGTQKMHAECLEAMHSLASRERGAITFTPWDHPRGGINEDAWGEA